MMESTSPAALRVVAIGGGGGATQVLRAVAGFATERTAVIAVTDTGRSTGLARAIGQIPAPGDLRATIAAFAGDATVAALLQHRFDGRVVPQLEGMAFGNLLIAALAQVGGDFGAAVQRVARLADSRVTVLPVSHHDTQLCAILADGRRVDGELAVRGPDKPAIAQVFLAPPAPATAAACDAVRHADLVVIGPGSLFTTVLATLAFDGMAAALAASHGALVYVANTTTQTGQTETVDVVGHVRRVIEAIAPARLAAVLLNTGAVDAATRGRLAAQGLVPLHVDDAVIAAVAALGPRVVARPLGEDGGADRVLWQKQDTIRHDTARLGAALRDAVLSGQTRKDHA